ncbi:CWF19-like protein 1 [Zootermopsis nevadensis]|uniref:CWF19-like protein 1 n=1 Tax=Zootermopsis nevadensis TaxID=136037 RepID=UPI000B8E6FDA|nr:CWF19-like protein 1 [Zootermopsis nevadensis]
MNKPKILICGDVEGKFKTLFSRVDNINKGHGPFDLLFCVGKFFGATDEGLEPYRNGSLTVPIPTYILGPSSPEQVALYSDISGYEVCPNVSYLGKRGLFTTTSGLKLVYVSGIEAESDEPLHHTFTNNDIESLKNICLRGQTNFRGVDILITSSWPKNIMLGDKSDHVQIEPNGSWLVSWLAAHLKPRYHFCGMEGIYFERAPYRNHSFSGDTLEHATRFIGLAKVGNSLKQKWLYAFSLLPVDEMKASHLYQETTDQTDCPYTGGMLKPILSKKQARSSQFFYDLDSPTDEGNQRKKARKDDKWKDRRKPPIFDQESCWFCLASAAVEKHLVISIGNESYLALAKGGMVPDHVLILPVGHHQSLSSIPEAVEEEIEKFKFALKKFFKKQQKVPVFFERNYKTSHLQIQTVPIPRDMATRLKDVFQESAEQDGIQLDELPPHTKLSQIAPPRTPYFYVELPSGDKLYHRITNSFPLQFGREVLASEELLDKVDRADWRDCKATREEETELAKEFRSAFQPFDFTL